MNNKELVLYALEKNRGKFISGEYLAGLAGISRMAVCKIISNLKTQGHRISAQNGKGYIMDLKSDVLSEKGITSNLKPDTKIKRVVCLDEVNSTNTYAKKIALDENAPHGTLITANKQTAGKGRRGHSFESPPGTGLYMTLILRPNFDNTGKFQMITIAAAVAVCFAVEDLTGLKPKIKWVNDVYLGDKKICGILTEAVSNFENGEIESVVTGIGVNISTKKFDDAQNAGSIFESAGNKKIKPFGRDELAAKIADYLIDFSSELDNPDLINEYRKRSMLLGKDINYMKGERKYRAHVEGIDNSGGLLIKNENGKFETLRSGEVFMIRQE